VVATSARCHPMVENPAVEISLPSPFAFQEDWIFQPGWRGNLVGWPLAKFAVMTASNNKILAPKKDIRDMFHCK